MIELLVISVVECMNDLRFLLLQHIRKHLISFGQKSHKIGYIHQMY